jgi:hypothetical protein
MHDREKKEPEELTNEVIGFSSPLRDQVTLLSPPPRMQGEDREPTDAGSVLKDINTGRSILHGCSSLSLKRLFEEFESKDDKNDSNTRKLKLISPSSIQLTLPSSSSGGDIVRENEEEEEEMMVDLDMPQILSPIIPPGRTSTLHAAPLKTTQHTRSVSLDEPSCTSTRVIVPRIALSARPVVRFQEHSFIPIRVNSKDDDEEDSP